MNKIIIKVILAIAIGVLVGTITGNLESNKKTIYFMYSEGGGFEIPKEKYIELKDNALLNKKISFNKELGFYYGAITSSSLIILLLAPNLLKKQDD